MSFSSLSFPTARIACMLFFVGPGLAYGMFTARMPALKAQSGALESEIGFILLAFGLAAIVGMTASARIISRFGARRSIFGFTLLYILSLASCSLASSPLAFGLTAAALGATMALVDVAMNVVGVEIERRYKKTCMSILHAGYNMGAILGSSSGALFAAAGLGTAYNFTLPFVIYILAIVWAYPRLVEPNFGGSDSSKGTQKSRVPLFVFACGFLCTIIYVSEGSVAEWGSLYLYQVKNTPESTAALVYGTYSTCALMCRLVGDRLRVAFGDFTLCFSCALLTVFGMGCALFSPWWQLSLTGYAIVGIGMGPLVPTLFSRAGRCEGISPERATAIVSICAYSGLLVCPPAFGLLAQAYGLTVSLSTVLVLLMILAAGMFIMRRPVHNIGKELDSK